MIIKFQATSSESAALWWIYIPNKLSSALQLLSFDLLHDADPRRILRLPWSKLPRMLPMLGYFRESAVRQSTVSLLEQIREFSG